MNPRTFQFSPVVILLATLLAAPICAFSQAPAAPQAQPVPSDAPPQLETGDDSTNPGITVRQPDNKPVITERRQGGEIKDIKVKSGKSTYHLKPGSTAANNAQGGASTTHPAQWVIKEFGAGSKPNKEAVDPATLPPASGADKSASEKK